MKKPHPSEINCIHFEARLIKRRGKDAALASAKGRASVTDHLILKICHFPLPSLSGFQCAVKAKGLKCPHNGPYGPN